MYTETRSTASRINITSPIIFTMQAHITDVKPYDAIGTLPTIDLKDKDNEGGVTVKDDVANVIILYPSMSVAHVLARMVDLLSKEGSSTRKIPSVVGHPNRDTGEQLWACPYASVDSRWMELSAEEAGVDSEDEEEEGHQEGFQDRGTKYFSGAWELAAKESRRTGITVNVEVRP